MTGNARPISLAAANGNGIGHAMRSGFDELGPVSGNFR